MKSFHTNFLRRRRFRELHRFHESCVDGIEECPHPQCRGIRTIMDYEGQYFYYEDDRYGGGNAHHPLESHHRARLHRDARAPAHGINWKNVILAVIFSILFIWQHDENVFRRVANRVYEIRTENKAGSSVARQEAPDLAPAAPAWPYRGAVLGRIREK